jgi:DNA-binding PadR family transcriptional regulator
MTTVDKTMDGSLRDKAQSLTPEGIQKLERLKAELESLSHAIQNMDEKNSYEVEDRVRMFQEKESEIKKFLRELGLMP